MKLTYPNFANFTLLTLNILLFRAAIPNSKLFTTFTNCPCRPLSIFTDFTFSSLNFFYFSSSLTAASPRSSFFSIFTDRPFRPILSIFVTIKLIHQVCIFDKLTPTLQTSHFCFSMSLLPVQLSLRRIFIPFLQFVHADHPY